MVTYQKDVGKKRLTSTTHSDLKQNTLYQVNHTFFLNMQPAILTFYFAVTRRIIRIEGKTSRRHSLLEAETLIQVQVFYKVYKIDMIISILLCIQCNLAAYDDTIYTNVCCPCKMCWTSKHVNHGFSGRVNLNVMLSLGM